MENIKTISIAVILLFAIVSIGYIALSARKPTKKA